MVAEHTSTVIQMNSNELDMNFVEGVKKLFPNQKIIVRVETAASGFEEKILSRAQDLDDGHGISFTPKEFSAFTDKLK